MSITDLNKELKGTHFQEELLTNLVERGFGSLPARETALTILELILKHRPGWDENPPEDYELARLLRTSPRRIRGLIDDLAYRDPEKGDDWCKDKLTSLLLSAERIKDGAFVTFEIDDGLVRDYAKKLVRKNLGVFEFGISSSVVRISAKQFMSLIFVLLDKAEFAKLSKVLSKEMKQLSSDSKESPVKLFVNSFMESAGKEAGKKGVDLAFTVLSGGLSDVSGAVDYLKDLLKGG